MSNKKAFTRTASLADVQIAYRGNVKQGLPKRAALKAAVRTQQL
jgi:hypothetical protein